jgi:hypothetical protein
MKNINQIPFTTLFAFGSFVIGTIFFLSYLIFPSENILVFGVLYVFGAFCFNLLILINLFCQLVTIRGERLNTFIKILIVLSNIPIALIYLIIIDNLNFTAST